MVSVLIPSSHDSVEAYGTTPRVVQEYLNSVFERRWFWIGSLQFRGDELQRANNMSGCKAEIRPVQMGYLDDRHPLIWNLHSCQSSECSRPHDLVYALVHISSDFKRLPFKVDYTLPLTEVFRSVAELAIHGVNRDVVDNPDVHSGDVLGLLALATTRLSYQFRNRRFPHFPSWIPDWRSAIEYMAPEHETAVRSRGASPWGRRGLPASVVEVCEDCLVMRGEIMTICFACEERGKDPSGCRCCCHFGGEWERWSAELKREMLRGKSDCNVIFVPEVVAPTQPSSAFKRGIAFVMTELAEACLELRYCFSVKEPLAAEHLRASVVRIY